MSARIDLMGLPVDVLDPESTVEHVVSEVEAGRGGYLLTPNLDHLRHYVLEPDTRPLLREAPLIVADGMPLVWASRVQGTALPRRVPGSDLILQLAEAAAAHGLRVFLLGAGPGVAARCAEELCRRFPALDVVGVHSPPMAFEDDEEALEAIRSELVAARPDLVVMGLPFPKQERLGAQLRHVLPRAWFAGLGASLDFVAGEVVRAPAWMHDSGLEWLHRLRCEPRRLFQRYVVKGLPFAAQLALHALLRRGLRVLERA